MRVYAWVGGDEPAEIADQVAAQLDAGMTAVKMNASDRIQPSPSLAEINEIVSRLAAARSVLGDSRDVAIDLHGRVGVAAARRILHSVEELHPLFVEEPVLPEHLHHLPEVISSSTVPVALGERLYNRSEFVPALDAGVAVVQPDVSHAGGISESYGGSQYWPRRMGRCLLRIVRWGRSHWPPACRCPSRRRTS